MGFPSLRCQFDSDTALSITACGGTGRHACLRNMCRRACGFDSHLADNKCAMVQRLEYVVWDHVTPVRIRVVQLVNEALTNEAMGHPVRSSNMNR